MTSLQLLEHDIKTRLADHLLRMSVDDAVFAVEVPFADAARRADFLCINGKTTAFEIKSDRDRICSLRSQIDDYKKCFDEVYAVTTLTHIKSVRENLPKSVGLILVDEKDTKVLRPARASKRLCKMMLASFLTKPELLALLSKSSKSISKSVQIQEIRKVVARDVSIEVLKTAVTLNLKTKYRTGHGQFIKYRGEKTHSDDLLHLGLSENSLG